MSSKGYGLERSRLGAALFAALVMPVAGTAFAQDAGATQDQTPTAADAKATNLDKIVVTGSLIPQTSVETFKPVTIISAEDLQTRGFTDVQDALHSSLVRHRRRAGQPVFRLVHPGRRDQQPVRPQPGYTNT
jgi:hypothetical protein